MSLRGYIYIPINPEPWAIGPLGIGKREGKFFPYVGRNQQLDAFKQAVAGELDEHEKMPEGEYQLQFWFWRRLDSYQTQKGRAHTKHQADTTNLQKATEDALQGVLFDNDRDVRKVTSEIVAQGPDVIGGILLHVQEYFYNDPPRGLPADVGMLRRNHLHLIDNPPDSDSNIWTGPPSSDRTSLGYPTDPRGNTPPQYGGGYGSQGPGWSSG